MRRILAVAFISLLILSLLTGCLYKKPDNRQEVAVNPPKDAKIKDYTPSEGVELTVSDANVKVGDTFTLTVDLKNPGWSFVSFEFIGTYDPGIMKVKSLKKTEFTNSMLDMGNPALAENQFKVAYATAEDMTGQGQLLTIECQALKAGTCSIDLSEAIVFRWVTYEDGKGGSQEIPLKINPATITITE